MLLLATHHCALFCRNGITSLVAHPASYAVVPAAAADSTGSARPTALVTPGLADNPGASYVAASDFPELKTLNLCNNPLTSWAQLHALARLPKLEWLQVWGRVECCIVVAVPRVPHSVFVR
jgi:hypothetical protein